MSSLSQIAPDIIQVNDDEFEISSFKKSDQWYRVKILERVNNMPILGACSCPHFEFRRVQCKHIQTVISEVVNK
jgi:hypothetical protein